MRCALAALLVLPLICCAAAPAVAQQFQDIAPMLGLPGTNGAAWGDYDGDGYPDLFLAGRVAPDGHGPMLLRNNHTGAFTDVSAAMGFPSDQEEQDGPGWADYDNDGDLDLIVACGSGPVKLYRNDGDTFTDVAASAGVDVADGPGRGVAWCDYDADGWLDVFICNTLGVPCYLLHSNGNGTFSDAAPTSGMTGAAAPTGGNAAAWGDYDNDGWADLAVSRMGARPMLYHNDGDGTFAEVGVAAGLAVASDTFGVAWGDYDNDGWLDCYLTSAALAPDWLFHNNGEGTFADVAATAGMADDKHTGLGAAWADYDNDGWLDLYVGNIDTNNQPFLYHNNWNGTFTDVAQTAGVGGSRGNETAIWGDMTLDGRMDLFSGVAGPLSALFRNIGSVGNWLRVRVLTSGTGDAVDPAVPVRDAIGARVELDLDNDDTFPSGSTRIREIDGGSSFLGQNEQVAHFGVGGSTLVCVRVRFPDGSVVTHRSVPVNQQIVIKDIPTDRTEEIFDDVPLDFWAYDAIKGCVDAAIVAGYEDGLYHGDWAVTRGQMAVYIARALVAPSGEAALADYVPSDPRNFPDAPPTGYGDDGTEPYWAYRHIEYCVENGVVQGYLDGNYHPDEEVNRAQMAVYVARSLVAPSGEAGLADYTPDDPRNFPDVPDTGYGDDGTEPYWAYTHVEYCVEHEVVQGYLDGLYHPDEVVTRAQMAIYVARAFGLAS